MLKVCCVYEEFTYRRYSTNYVYFSININKLLISFNVDWYYLVEYSKTENRWIAFSRMTFRGCGFE